MWITQKEENKKGSVPEVIEFLKKKIDAGKEEKKTASPCSSLKLKINPTKRARSQLPCRNSKSSCQNEKAQNAVNNQFAEKRRQKFPDFFIRNQCSVNPCNSMVICYA